MSEHLDLVVSRLKNMVSRITAKDADFDSLCQQHAEVTAGIRPADLHEPYRILVRTRSGIEITLAAGDRQQQRLGYPMGSRGPGEAFPPSEIADRLKLVCPRGKRGPALFEFVARLWRAGVFRSALLRAGLRQR